MTVKGLYGNVTIIKKILLVFPNAVTNNESNDLLKSNEVQHLHRHILHLGYIQIFQEKTTSNSL